MKQRTVASFFRNNWKYWFFPMLLIYWSIGFYPFHWLNPAYFHQNAGTNINTQSLDFPADGIGYTKDVPGWLTPAIQTQSLYIKLEVKALRTHQYGPARIFTISRNTGERNLTLGQAGTDLILRIRKADTDINGMPDYAIKNIFTRQGWHSIELTISPEWLRLLVDGNIQINEPLPGNALNNWSTDYRAAFGNEFTFNRPWHGSIRVAEISTPKGITNYISDGQLSFPKTYVLFNINWRFEFVPAPFREKFNSAFWQDWLINFIGFIPLGALLLVFGPKMNLLRVTIWCFAVSLSIEFMQIFWALRHPSIDDLILNTMGGYSGAWITYILRQYRFPSWAFGNNK